MKRPAIRKTPLPPPVVENAHDSFDDEEVEDDSQLKEIVQSQRMATQQLASQVITIASQTKQSSVTVFKRPEMPAVRINRHPFPQSIVPPMTRIIRPSFQPRSSTSTTTIIRPRLPQQPATSSAPTTSKPPQPKQLQIKKSMKAVSTQTMNTFQDLSTAPLKSRKFNGQFELLWQKRNELKEPEISFHDSFSKYYNFYGLENNQKEKVIDNGDNVENDFQ